MRPSWILAWCGCATIVGGQSFAQSNSARTAVAQRLPPVTLPTETPPAVRRDLERLPRVAARSVLPASPPPSTNLPEATSSVWWENLIGQPLRSDATSLPLQLESLLVAALRHSPRVQAIADEPVIRRQSIIEADAEFDVKAFMETKMAKASDPVGNTLTVGPGGTRFRQEDWDFSGGMRRKNRVGGQFEASQEIGTLTNNSQFLVPPQQGNSRLTLSLNQPLLNGAGRQYNESLIVLAQLDERASWSRTSQELQEHLTSVVDAYWELYSQRASLVQKQQHHARAVEILTQLEARVGLDSLRSQILRAQAAVATRRAALIRAETMVRNAESRIRALVAAPEMLADRRVELLPLDAPITSIDAVDQRATLVTALENRPEIDEAVQLVSAAGVRLEMSKNELLPVLDAVVEMYVAGLDGNYGIGQSLVDQFSVGEPGYTAGLVFELPVHNRAARARLRRRTVELRQLRSQFQDTIQTISAEVEIATREVATSYREMQARQAAVKAAEADVGYLSERWQLIPGEDRAASFILEDLLDAQDRLVDEEFRFADAQRAYMVSLTTLRRATGVLLQHENVFPAEIDESGVPRIQFEKPVGGEQTLPAMAFPAEAYPAQTFPAEALPEPMLNGPAPNSVPRQSEPLFSPPMHNAQAGNAQLRPTPTSARRTAEPPTAGSGGIDRPGREAEFESVGLPSERPDLVPLPHPPSPRDSTRSRRIVDETP